MGSSTVSNRRLVEVDQAKGRFRVNRDAFRSQEVFELEKERIFNKCWLYLGHVTELKNPGDFVARTVIGRDLIFMRARDGSINAFYNSCTHRGARVCRDKSGNTKNFACPYHGWVFNTEGKLVSMNTKDGYVEGINADGALNLRRVPRLEHYRGFYFVNYDANAISLSDYLADAKSFIDLMCDQSDDGEVTIIPGEHHYAVNANYKFMCENSYDGYHLLPTHVSYLEFLDEQSNLTGKDSAVQFLLNQYAKQGRGFGMGHGHGGLESWVASGRPVAQWIPVWGPEIKAEIDAKRAQLVAKFGEKRAGLIADVQKNMVIFPNLVLNDNVGFTVRVIEPESPSRMRINAWAFAPASESPRMRALRLDNFVSFLGPSGFGSADDVEMLELCQRGLDHTAVEWNEISKNLKPTGDLRYEESAPDGEAQMRAYWSQWDRLMRNDHPFTASGDVRMAAAGGK